MYVSREFMQSSKGKTFDVYSFGKEIAKPEEAESLNKLSNTEKRVSKLNKSTDSKKQK